MLFLDTLREIKKSFGRFFSIFAIVAIGVAFFAGIISTEPDMKNSADHYYDAYNLMDYTVHGSYGLTDDDIVELKRVAEVEGVMPAHTYDVMGKVKGANGELVIRLHGIPDNLNFNNNHYINRVILLEGRLPENENECLMEYQMKEFGLKIGDEIILSSGNDDLLEEKITIKTMKVVGLMQSPYYLSFEKGSSVIGMGSVNAYAFVFDSVFLMEYYTEAYITIKDSKDFNSYGEAYFEFLIESRNQIKLLGQKQSELRYEEIMEEARNELEKRKQEYEDALVAFEIEIEKAEKEIEDAKIKLITAQITLDNNIVNIQTQIESGKEQLAILKGILDTTEEQYKNAKQLYDNQYGNIITYRDDLQNEINLVQTSYPDLDTEVAGLLAIPESSRTPEQIARLTLLQSVQQDRDQKQTELDAINAMLTLSDAGILQIESQLNSLKQQYATQLKTIEDLEKQAQEGFKQAQEEIDKGNADLLSAELELKIKKKKAEADLEDAAELLKKAELDIENIPSPEWYVLDRKSHYGYRDYEGAANRIKAIGEVFPVFFFLVAALVALTTMTRMVDEQRQTIGTLKALGYGKGAIASKYIMYAFISSSLGAVFGLSIGLTLFPTLIFNAWNIMYNIPAIHIKFQPALMVLSAGIGISVTTIAAILACYKELVETPALLMRPKSPRSGKRIILEKITVIWERLTFSEKVTMRNLFRYKKRLYMTVVGISGCTSLILAGFGIRDSINSIIEIQFEEIYHYDVTVNLSDDFSSFDKETALENINTYKNVANSIMVSSDNATMYYEDEEIAVTLIVPTDIIQLKDFVLLQNIDTKKEYTLSDDGVIISQKMANNNGMKVGDTISITQRNGYQKTFKIEAIAENYVGNFVFMSADLYQKSYGIKPINTTIYVNLIENGIENEREFSRIATSEKAVRSVAFFSNSAETFSNMISSLDIVIIVLIISAGLLAFVVLYNLNNVNISERIREIATIKVLGFKDREVAQYINRESILLTVLGALIGLVVGRILHLFIMNVIELDQIMFTREVSVLSHAIAFGFTILFGFIVNFVMKFKLRKIPMVESLKSVE